MTFPKARLVVAAVLFVGWLGFLLFLVLESGTVVLSRPQFLVAQLYVVAEIGRGEEGGLDPRVTIDEVLWSADPAGSGLATQTIELPQLARCDKKHGNQGPGKYILPLQKTAKGKLEITPIPGEGRIDWEGRREIHIYPLTSATRAQVDAMIRAKR